MILVHDYSDGEPRLINPDEISEIWGRPNEEYRTVTYKGEEELQIKETVEEIHAQTRAT